MSDAAVDLLETVLADIGYRTQRLAEREGFLGENATRVVWAVVFDGVLDLLDGWEDEQAWLVDMARGRLTVDKAWELYLVLACRPDPDDDELRALQAVQRDAAYARKLIVPGIDGLTPTGALDYLAPLEELQLPTPEQPPDALRLLEEQAQRDRRDDVLTALRAYRVNRPLFEQA